MILYYLRIRFLQIEVSFLYDLLPVSQMSRFLPHVLVVLFTGRLSDNESLRFPCQNVIDFPELSITECKIDTETVRYIVFLERCSFQCVNRTLFSLDSV